MEKKLVKKRDYAWNMLGSICYSGASFYYLLLVTRICGVKDAGVFSLAFATAQLLLTLGRFGIRTYQATDLKRQYSFREYGIARVITCLLMLLGAVFYVFFMKFDAWKAQVCIWVTAFKMIDAVEDVFHGEMQRLFRVDLMGKLLALRNVLSCMFFTLFAIVTKDVLMTCVYTTIPSLLVCVVCNGWGLKKISRNQEAFLFVHVKRMLMICFPIFLSTFLSLYLYNVPKYAIDLYMVVENQTYYSILFMPSFVITLFSEIITKPLMTTITIAWEQDINQFKKIVWHILVLIGCGTIIIILGGHLIGRHLLELIYGVDLELYKKEFVILLIGGGVSAGVYILYNFLIAIRHEKCIIIAYVGVAVAMTGLVFLMVKSGGILGASLGYLISCLLLFLLFLLLLILFIKDNEGGRHYG